MIHGPDGAKLSKRHGAQAVSEFADMGYLPEAMRNYLARLGWGHGDDEIFSDDQAIAWFDVDDVVSAPARLDWAKLNHVNNHYIRLADDERLTAARRRGAREPRRSQSARPSPRSLRTIPLVKDGAKTLLELADLTALRAKDAPARLDEKARALLDEETRARLARLNDRLADEPDWIAAELTAPCALSPKARASASANSAPALRAVLSGGAAGARPRQRPGSAGSRREPRAASRMLFRKRSKPAIRR